MTQLILFPDADVIVVSEPANEFDSDYENDQSDIESCDMSEDDVPLAEFAADSPSGHANSDDDIPLAYISRQTLAETQKSSHTFQWRK